MNDTFLAVTGIASGLVSIVAGVWAAVSVYQWANSDGAFETTAIALLIAIWTLQGSLALSDLGRRRGVIK